MDSVGGSEGFWCWTRGEVQGMANRLDRWWVGEGSYVIQYLANKEVDMDLIDWWRMMMVAQQQVF